MTIEEIDDSLPNGFHDSYVKGIHIDYTKREAIFTLDVDAQETYRPARLRLSGLLYVAIEPPRQPFTEEYVPVDDKLWITADSSDFSLLKSVPELPVPIPRGGFRHWFFISSHNCFIYVAAMDASFDWLG